MRGQPQQASPVIDAQSAAILEHAGRAAARMCASAGWLDSLEEPGPEKQSISFEQNALTANA
jgi:hypothetical protein